MIKGYYYGAVLIVLLVYLAACKKDSSNQTAVPVIYHDTLIILQNQGPPVRLSFAPNTFIDLSFNSNIYKSRCPNCLTQGAAQCPYRGIAYTNFLVKNQNGDSMTLQGDFKSCYAQNDTTPGTVNNVGAFSPFNEYNIWPISLNPYPTDTVYFHYTLTLLVQYPAKL